MYSSTKKVQKEERRERQGPIKSSYKKSSYEKEGVETCTRNAVGIVRKVERKPEKRQNER